MSSPPFIVDCRARRLSPKTVSSYLEAVASFLTSPLGGRQQTLANLTLDAGRSERSSDGWT